VRFNIAYRIRVTREGFQKHHDTVHEVIKLGLDKFGERRR